MTGAFTKFVGIDWSGAKGRRHRGIAVATCGPSGDVEIVRPPGRHWSRVEVVEWVARQPSGTVIGFDFAFGLQWPAAGPLPAGLGRPQDAFGLWDLIDDLCRDEADFYAGPIYRPDGGLLADFMFTRLTGAATWSGPNYDPGRLRETELRLRPRPNSPFKIVGAKTVGPGSFSGMRILSRLRQVLGERLAVWPFQEPDPGGVTICEIYPSAFYLRQGHRRTARPDIVAQILTGYGARPPTGGAWSQDQCDAIVSAAALRALSADEALWHGLPEIAAREGWIFGVPPRAE